MDAMHSLATTQAVAPRSRQTDDIRPHSRALGLTAICLGFLMITLDATIVNVALGPIGSDLGGALSTAQWIVNGYALAFAALLLSAGALADRIGSRTGFLIGLAIFGLGSAAARARDTASAPASGVFDASRQSGGALRIAVLGTLLVAGQGPVSLHVAFVATAGC